MMKCWTREISQAVLDSLNKLWLNKTTPEYWGNKWLCLIPKVADPELHQLRPLMLLEAVRKVWTGVIMRRIQGHLGRNGILHKSQHGFMSEGARTPQSRLC